MGSGIRLFAFMGRGWHQGLGPPCDLNHSPPLSGPTSAFSGASLTLCVPWAGWQGGGKRAMTYPHRNPRSQCLGDPCPPTSPQRTLPCRWLARAQPQLPQDPRRLNTFRTAQTPQTHLPQGLQQAEGSPRTGWYPAPACALLPALRPAPRSPKCCWISEWGGAWEGRWVDRWTEEGMDGWMDNG